MEFKMKLKTLSEFYNDWSAKYNGYPPILNQIRVE